MTTVNMFEAKTKLSKLVQAVESGAEEEIIIARNGKPVARIVALEAPVVDVSKRLGIADGEFGEFDYEAFQALDKEIWKGFWEKPLLPEPRRQSKPKRKKSG